ncbi:endolytic transglycosylase MltG [Rhabdaerophilum calidifontis]|uniref:endolytic transglycosylase MltG n=1 Tax=Rhabdaerophilum calidifontis TaxID=2604328 RepID=UPI001239C046|nr:endolytic transglycosylase MltG [Rhabdaerophilum calidifontis]
MARKPDDNPGEGETARRGWFGSRRRPAVGEAVNAAIAPPPPPRRRRQGLVGLFSGLMTVALIAALALGGVLVVARKEFVAPGPLVADKSVVIERGSSSEEIVDLLEREGVIARPTLFWIALLWRDVQSKFATDDKSLRAKAGEYLFKRQVSMNEVIDILSSGRSVEHTITIPEGLTSEQIVERLKENDLLTGEIAQIPAEGTLLPETYKINRGTTREALLARMQREHRRVADEAWKRRAKDLPLRNPRELITLASIVEKETGRADERSRVAGVFYNRLGKNMKLQSDPTIIYGLVGGKATLGRGINRDEILRPTPYNTYVITGLPPGPIANPGRAAIEATANPSRTKDLYFVADGTGGHAFAETLEQHNRNVARWRQIEASRPPAEGAPASPAPPAGDRSQINEGAAPVTGFAPAATGTTRPLAAPGRAEPARRAQSPAQPLPGRADPQ